MFANPDFRFTLFRKYLKISKQTEEDASFSKKDKLNLNE